MRHTRTAGTAAAGVVRPRRTPARGWFGRGAGRAVFVQPAGEWRGTSVQVCGLWPFAVGAGTPMVGVPLGRNLVTGATLCCDPIGWFTRAALISNPSAFVLAKPGLGKSTLVRRMATGLSGFGVIPLVLGDLRPDYVDLIRQLGGQVITLGRARGHLNILDPGQASAAAARLRAAGHASLAARVVADAAGRRLSMVAALVTILRGAPPAEREERILHRALRVLDDRHQGVPILADLLQVIRDGPGEVRAVALDRGDDGRYQAITEDLEGSLISLCGAGRLGAMFAAPTEQPMRRDRPVVFDISGIDESEVDLRAAALLACWSAGFGTVDVASALADAGVEPRRHYLVVMDELWQALRAGSGLVDRVDALTRLNRKHGVGQVMISHTMSDLAAVPDAADRAKALGFVERSGMVICGGLPAREIPMLTGAIALTRAERDLLAGWCDPPSWDPIAGAEADPPGRGNFLVKVGGRPGIPIHVDLTAAEAAASDTNRLWHEMSRIAPTGDGVGGDGR